MPEPKHPPSNKDEVIDRLINENTKANQLLEELRLQIRLDGEFEGCSLLGGLKAIINAYRKVKDENLTLKSEIQKLKNKR